MKAEEDKGSTTHSGISLKSAYSRQDIDGLGEELPGEYPFTRGTSLSPFGSLQAEDTMFFGYGLPEDTRRRMDLLIKEGVKKFIIAFDLPTYMGYDPDHPIARGRVGQHTGVSLCNTEDFARLLDGIAIDKTYIAFPLGVPTVVMLAMYVAYAEKRGIPASQLVGRTANYLHRFGIVHDTGFSPKVSLRLIVEVVRYCTKNMPKWEVMSGDSYVIREKGANAVQEVAFILAVLRAVTERAKEVGVDPDEFLSKVRFYMAVERDFFEEIAKFRALRRLWAKINRERFGCKNPQSLRARIHAHTAGSVLTAQQPLNNLVRVTFQAMAAILGGVDTLHTSAYDEALAIPSEEAVTLAMRTKQILLQESNIIKVADPLGGSYYVESLSRKIEEEVEKILEEIENRGGVLACWESGWFLRKIEEEAYKWSEQVTKREKIIVGVNEYLTGEEREVQSFRVDPEVEKIAVQRLEAFKNRRDRGRVEASLRKLKDGLQKDGEFLPAFIEAAKAEATLGEMTEVLREVLDYGRFF